MILDGLVENVIVGIEEVANDDVLDSEIVGDTDFLTEGKDDGETDEISN